MKGALIQCRKAKFSRHLLIASISLFDAIHYSLTMPQSFNYKYVMTVSIKVAWILVWDSLPRGIVQNYSQIVVQIVERFIQTTIVLVFKSAALLAAPTNNSSVSWALLLVALNKFYCTMFSAFTVFLSPHAHQLQPIISRKIRFPVIPKSSGITRSFQRLIFRVSTSQLFLL